MGRPPWATPEQTEFLGSFLQNLDREKEGNGLKQYYQRISSQFLEKWPAEPTNEERKAVSDPQKLQELAEARRTKQIHQWYKTQRKQGSQASQPKAPLDLSGRSNRKRAPYQFHHAFSVRYCKKDSPLHQEVGDLWSRRSEQSVIDLLAPFTNTDDCPRLQFHNAVMRWKCSLLTDEQRQEHQDWIDQNLLEKEDQAKRPWKAMLAEGDDELVAENSYIQSCIDALPTVVNKALEQIEHTTGMKAIILIGGPTPAMKGDICTHVFESGKSRDDDLDFSKYWLEFDSFHDAFVEWLRSVYSKEEISRRKGHANLSKRATPTTDNDTAIVTRQAEVTPPPPAPPSLPPPGPMLPQTCSKSPNGPTLRPQQTIPDVPLQHPPSSSSQQDQSPGPARQQTRSQPPDGPTPQPRQTVPDVPLQHPPSSPPQQEPSPSPARSAAPLSPRGDPSIEPTSASRRAPPPAGTFTFAGTSPFITTAAIDYLQTIPAGQRWVDMIVSYLRLEEAPVSKGSIARLSTASRPEEVSTWMKTRTYSPHRIPFVSNVQSYRDGWVAWWTSCQPPWRQKNEWPLSRECPSTVNWAKVGARGQSGLFLVIMSTTWWAASIECEDDWVEFDAAVDDVKWLIDRITEALPARMPSETPDTPNTPEPVVLPNYLVRAAGKRKTKPTS